MSIEENKGLYRRYVEVLKAKNLDVHNELLAPNFLAHDLPPGLPLKAFRQMVNAAFPDQDLVLEDLVAEGDRVAARLTVNQTHRGEFQVIRATGKKLEFELFEIVRVEDGKIAERWVTFDRGGLMQELGVT